MPNKTYAQEWLVKAWHDLSSAKVLYEADHFTDSIAGDLQQAIEKTLKSLLAFHCRHIKKTHNLVELAELVAEYMKLDESEMELLAMGTLYYIQERYPAMESALPSRQQIQILLDFAEDLFGKTCKLLKISEQDVMK